MHVKFIARGTGSAGAAVDYLLGERDAAGELRDGVEVRRGDPHAVAAVADALEFEHKYTSGVIAWAPEDRPTDAQIEAVLDKFEKTAWAGLEPDRYAWTAVECSASTTLASWRQLFWQVQVRPGDGQEPQHRAAGLGEDLRSAARRLQPRERMEPARRPGPRQGAAARTPRLDRRGEPAGRSGGRGRPARTDPGLPGAARRARRRARPRRRRRRPEGSRP